MARGRGGNENSEGGAPLALEVIASDFLLEIEVEGFIPYEEDLGAADLGPGETFILNGGAPITLSPWPL